MPQLVQLELMECIRCRHRYSIEDVRELRFFPSTMICFNCYKRGQKAAFAVWCFGKPSVITETGSILQSGYDPDAKPCAEECPDREICRLFMETRLGEGKGDLNMRKRKKEELVCPFRETHSLTARAWMMCATNGVRVRELIKWVEKQGGEPGRILRLVRSGRHLNLRWVVDEHDGFLKIWYEQ